jgi:hypothetical protein
MELFPDIDTAEKIDWGASGLLSFILLIVYLRWAGPPEDQEKDEPAKEPKRQDD